MKYQIERELSDLLAKLDADCDLHTLDDLVSHMDCGLRAKNEDKDATTCLTCNWRSLQV